MKRFTVFFLTLSLLAAAIIIPAASVGTMDARTLAMLNKPAVVMLYAQHIAETQIYEFDIDYDALDSLQEYLIDELLTLIEEGELDGTDLNAIMAMTLLFLFENIHLCVYRTGGVQSLSDVEMGMTGSGFIITPDGYLITNAHVVAPDESELQYRFAVAVLEQFESEVFGGIYEAFTQEFQASAQASGYEISPEEYDFIYQKMFELCANHLEVGNLQVKYYYIMGNTPQGSTLKEMELIDIAGLGMTQDLALMKMVGVDNLPTVTLGDNSTLRTGDQIYAMGFPAVATTSGVVDIWQAMQEPTFTQGVVSA